MIATRERARRMLIGPLVLAIMVAGLMPAAAAAANNTIAGLDATPQHYRAASGSVDIRVALRRAARVTVTVHRSNGRLVRTLAKNAVVTAGRETWRWDGRNQAGKVLRHGLYHVRVKAVNSRGTATEAVRFRKGLPPIYPARPGAIVVAIDPGHGGPYLGAYYKGSYEKHFNLDIALRLRTMLQRAGVQVVMTRTTDRVVNSPAVDVNGDGKITKADDLAARVDVANQARADVFVSIHNNSAACRCVRGTEVFVNRWREWTPESQALASWMHSEQLRALSTFRSRDYVPVNRGVKSGSFYVMTPYDAARRPRPSLMPTLLTESLYVNNDVELGLLKQPEVREALATSFYVGIANYLNTRDYGIGYQLVRQPSGPLAPGAKGRYVIRVTNRGNRRSSGWVLQLRTVRQVPLYDGSGSAGQMIGWKRIPDGLKPGQSVNIRVNVTAPKKAGFWLVKAGVGVDASSRALLAQRGVVELQIPLRTRR